MKIFLLLMLSSSFCWAMDSSKCSTMLNNGWYKKYKWRGVGEANVKAITAETKSSNFIVASTKISTEGSTASSDPKYSSNVTTSQAQSSSSWGQCSMFALRERFEQRDQYVAQNLEQIRKEVANGSGSHLETLAWFSLCEDKVQPDFNQSLQKNMKSLLVDEAAVFNKNVDSIIKDDAALSKQCYVLSAN